MRTRIDLLVVLVAMLASIPGLSHAGVCNGGFDDGAVCVDSSQCRSACVGGAFAGDVCSSDQQCLPLGTCSDVGICGPDPSLFAVPAVTGPGAVALVGVILGGGAWLARRRRA